MLFAYWVLLVVISKSNVANYDYQFWYCSSRRMLIWSFWGSWGSFSWEETSFFHPLANRFLQLLELIVLLFSKEARSIEMMCKFKQHQQSFDKQRYAHQQSCLLTLLELLARFAFCFEQPGQWNEINVDTIWCDISSKRLGLQKEMYWCDALTR